MVVNKDGDLELYAIHDTPKQIAWSSKGTLALGAGLGLKVLEGYNDEEEEFVSQEALQRRHMPVADRSTEIIFMNRDGSRARDGETRRTSRSPTAPRRSSSATRGRGRAPMVDHAGQLVPSLPVIPATPTVSATASSKSSAAQFGRGDEDGFPALPTPGLSTAAPTVGPVTSTTSTGPTDLSAAKPKNPRQSPSRIVGYSHARARSEEGRSEKSEQKQVSLSRSDTIPADHFEETNTYATDPAHWSKDTSKPGPAPDRAVSIKSPTRDTRGRERTRKSKEASVVSLVKEDISMVMRQRVKAGYGLSQVRQYSRFVLLSFRCLSTASTQYGCNAKSGYSRSGNSIVGDMGLAIPYVMWHSFYHCPNNFRMRQIHRKFSASQQPTCMDMTSLTKVFSVFGKVSHQRLPPSEDKLSMTHQQ